MLFVYTFPLFMILDFLCMTSGDGGLNFLLGVHHAVTVLGHLIVIRFAPVVFPTYFLGVAVLEFGSGATNLVDAMGRTSFGRERMEFFETFTALAMTASNVLSILLLWSWNRAAMPLAVKIFGSAVVLGFVYFRQLETMRQVGWAE